MFLFDIFPFLAIDILTLVNNERFVPVKDIDIFSLVLSDTVLESPPIVRFQQSGLLSWNVLQIFINSVSMGFKSSFVTEFNLNITSGIFLYFIVR